MMRYWSYNGWFKRLTVNLPLNEERLCWRTLFSSCGWIPESRDSIIVTAMTFCTRLTPSVRSVFVVRRSAKQPGAYLSNPFPLISESGQLAFMLNFLFKWLCQEHLTKRVDGIAFNFIVTKTKPKQNKTKQTDKQKKTCNLEVLLHWKTNCK